MPDNSIEPSVLDRAFCDSIELQLTCVICCVGLFVFVIDNVGIACGCVVMLLVVLSGACQLGCVDGCAGGHARYDGVWSGIWLVGCVELFRRLVGYLVSSSCVLIELVLIRLNFGDEVLVRGVDNVACKFL